MLKCDTLVSEIKLEVEEHMWDDLRHEAALKEVLKRWGGKVITITCKQTPGML